MKEIVKEKNEKQQKFTKSHKWQFWYHYDKNKKVQCDINDLKASLEHAETVMEEKVAKSEIEIEKMQDKLRNYVK